MSIKEADIKAADIKQKLEKRYNSATRPLPELELGSKVAVQDHTTKNGTGTASLYMSGKTKAI